MHFKRVKGLLSAKGGVNVYRGCTHGCIYCDSRSLCYQMDHLFEDIEVKENAPQVLEAELSRKRRPCMVGTGSMCDPYLPIEKDLKITRQCLEVIEKKGCGVSVLTKSDLVLRDLDILRRIHQKTKCVLQMTLTTADDLLCRKIEKAVCPTSRRLEVLKIFQQEGIPTVVWLCPILPFINDTEENLRGILQGCAEAGVWGIIHFGFGVTLRAGSRDYFYSQLDRAFPGMKKRYMDSFGQAYECPSPNHPQLETLFRSFCKEHQIRHEEREIFDFLSRFERRGEGEQLMFEGL